MKYTQQHLPRPLRAISFRLWRYLIALVALSVVASWGQVVAAPRVTLVAPDGEKDTERIVRGIRSSLARSGYDSLVTQVSLVGFPSPELNLVDSVRRTQPDVIITIGSRVTSIVSAKIKDIPIVFGAVSQPQSSGIVKSLDTPGGNVTGASLDIPAVIQFKYFQQLCPKVKRIGLIYSRETAALAQHAKIVAKASGLELIGIEIRSGGAGAAAKEVMAAIDSLSGLVDGLWSLADPVVFSAPATKALIRTTLAGRIPFMGFSSRLVESGALFALDYDYKDIGRQVAESASRILKGEDAGAIAVTRPGVIWFNYNEKTATHLALTLPEELRAVAREVFK